MTEKTGLALSRVKYRIDLNDEGQHEIAKLDGKEWRVVSTCKKFRDAVKMLNELRGVKK